MHEAALKADNDPDRLSFLHAVRVVRRKLPLFAALPPSGQLALHEAGLNEILEERVVSSRGRRVPRGVKRKLSNYPQPPRIVPSPACGGGLGRGASGGVRAACLPPPRPSPAAGEGVLSCGLRNPCSGRRLPSRRSGSVPGLSGRRSPWRSPLAPCRPRAASAVARGGGGGGGRGLGIVARFGAHDPHMAGRRGRLNRAAVPPRACSGTEFPERGRASGVCAQRQYAKAGEMMAYRRTLRQNLYLLRQLPGTRHCQVRRATPRRRTRGRWPST